MLYVPFLQEWFTVLEHYHRLSVTISDLIMGNSYSFRVFAENQVGRGEKSAATKKTATIQKTGEFIKLHVTFMLRVWFVYMKMALEWGWSPEYINELQLVCESLKWVFEEMKWPWHYFKQKWVTLLATAQLSHEFNSLWNY